MLVKKGDSMRTYYKRCLMKVDGMNILIMLIATCKSCVTSFSALKKHESKNQIKT